MTRVRRGATCNCYTLWHTQVVEKIMKVYWFWITHSLKNSNTNKLNSSHLNSFLNLTYKSFKENYDLRPFDCYHYVELFKNNFLIFIWSLISSHVILSNRLYCSRSNGNFKLIEFPYLFKLYHSKRLIFLQ